MSDTATETRNGMYDDVTVHDAFAWMDTLRGWDIATHCEYEALRDAALRHHDALAKALAEAEARAAEQEHLADMLQSRMRDAASALDRWRAVNAVAAEGALETVYAALMADPP